MDLKWIGGIKNGPEESIDAARTIRFRGCRIGIKETVKRMVAAFIRIIKIFKGSVMIV